MGARGRVGPYRPLCDHMGTYGTVWGHTGGWMRPSGFGPRRSLRGAAPGVACPLARSTWCAVLHGSHGLNLAAGCCRKLGARPRRVVLLAARCCSACSPRRCTTLGARLSARSAGHLSVLSPRRTVPRATRCTVPRKPWCTVRHASRCCVAFGARCSAVLGAGCCWAPGAQHPVVVGRVPQPVVSCLPSRASHGRHFPVTYLASAAGAAPGTAVHTRGARTWAHTWVQTCGRTPKRGRMPPCGRKRVRTGVEQGSTSARTSVCAQRW